MRIDVLCPGLNGAGHKKTPSPHKETKAFSSRVTTLIDAIIIAPSHFRCLVKRQQRSRVTSGTRIILLDFGDPLKGE